MSKTYSEKFKWKSAYQSGEGWVEAINNHTVDMITVKIHLGEGICEWGKNMYPATTHEYILELNKAEAVLKALQQVLK